MSASESTWTYFYIAVIAVKPPCAEKCMWHYNCCCFYFICCCCYCCCCVVIVSRFIIEQTRFWQISTIIMPKAALAVAVTKVKSSLLHLNKKLNEKKKLKSTHSSILSIYPPPTTTMYGCLWQWQSTYQPLTVWSKS